MMAGGPVRRAPLATGKGGPTNCCVMVRLALGSVPQASSAMRPGSLGSTAGSVPSPRERSRMAANPKSRILGTPSDVYPMLLGLMSRCRTPEPCTRSSASASSVPRSMTSSRAIGPRRSESSSVPPSRYFENEKRRALPLFCAINQRKIRVQDIRHGSGLAVQPRGMLEANRWQRLDRDFAVECQVNRQIYDTCSTGADESLDLELALDVERQRRFHRGGTAGTTRRGGPPHRTAFRTSCRRFVFPVGGRLIARARLRTRGRSLPQLTVFQLERRLSAHGGDQHAIPFGIREPVSALPDTDDAEQRAG